MKITIPDKCKGCQFYIACGCMLYGQLLDFHIDKPEWCTLNGEYELVKCEEEFWTNAKACRIP